MKPQPTETGFSTRAIHAGQAPDPLTGAIIPPLYLTSTYALEDVDKTKGFLYSRVGNPTRKALETNLAALEGGTAALAFASGMAAINAVMTLLNAGDHVICQDNLYGGSVRLFNQILRRFGIEFTYVDPSSPANLDAALRPNTKLLYLETPTNPLMHLIDLKLCAQWARRRKLLTAVDNTFMTPYYQRPIELGIDIVIHSTTKYLNGHSDGIGGAVVVNGAELAARLHFIQKAAGAILAPMECWLISRGVKTLAVRMRQHSANAMTIARWLAKQNKVRVVHYPGLPDHPQHKLARRQMSGFGGMLSFDLGTEARARRFAKRLKVFALGESLGGVESLIAYPKTMSHAGISAEERAGMGIGDGLLRVSAGIEDVADLIGDLQQALRAV